MSNQVRLLIAEDEERLRRLLQMLLSTQGYDLTLAADGAEAWEHFQAGHFDAVITDLRMPNMDGLTLLKKIKEQSSCTPVIVITAFGSIENAVEAMQAGAIDYVTKPFEETKLNVSIERALSFGRIMDENRNLRQLVAEKLNVGRMVAEAPSMKQVLECVRAVANSNANVLVYGESGTGKELITRAIHDSGGRKHKPFVAINCAAIPDNLLESELFGHEKGSFTGATDRKTGKFEQADGGSLFLDEIGEMNISVQAKLLRAIEQQEFQRVGGNRTIKTDVRFIAATNKDLRGAVRAGTFREDLFFRINVFPIHLPPLRDRHEDIIPLARFFLRKFCGEMGRRPANIARDAEGILMANSWQGNVRELQNTIERAVILLQGDVLTKDDLAFVTGAGMFGGAMGAEAGNNGKFLIPAAGFNMEEHEKDLLMQALDRSAGNKSRAAKLLGMSRATLRYRLEKFGVAVGEIDAEPDLIEV